MTSQRHPRRDSVFVLGVGAQKAGTTWLHRYLSDHPQVWMSPIKEMHFFDELYLPELCGKLARAFYVNWFRKSAQAIVRSRAPSERQIRMARDLLDRVEMQGDIARYRAFFDVRRGDALAWGEITPSYSMLEPDHLAAIAAAFPEARPVFLMRDPVDRYWSAMRMAARKGTVTSPVAAVPAKIAKSAHVMRGRYDRTLAGLDVAFGRDGYLTEFYEHLHSDVALVRICSFLGIDPSPGNFTDIHNASPSAESLNEEAESVIFAAFREVYDHIGERFGTLPRRWQDRIDSLG